MTWPATFSWITGLSGRAECFGGLKHGCFECWVDAGHDADAGAGPLLPAALETIVTAGRECLSEIRTVFNAADNTLEAELAMEPLPGLARLPELLDRVREAKLHVDLRIEGGPAALQPTVDLAAFRIIQEGLTNVLKHAGPPTTATVRIQYHPDRIEIEVENRATGYRDGDPLGRGLRGMHERASNLGGQLSISAANGSFRVKAVLPARTPL
jgi:signal transduction histidine kinase